MNVLRENILSEMNEREWNAYSLADESGVPQSTIHRFLSGKHTELRDSNVRKIAKGFKVSESKLRGFEPKIDKKIKKMSWYEQAKTILHKKKIVQEDLITVFGVTTRGAVGHYLSGRRKPSIEQLKNLADKLECTLDYLMDTSLAEELAMNEEAKNLSRNLRLLMDYHQDTQTTLAKKSTLSQRTIGNMLKPGDESSSTLANISLIAKAYKLPVWRLLYPDASLDILINPTIESFFKSYVKADNEIRDAWDRIVDVTNKKTLAG
jgi:transcriptional regulator with XRE-family HTH domain